MPTGITDFSRHGFCLQNLANLVLSLKETSLKSKKLNKTRIFSFTLRSEDFFSEIYYPSFSGTHSWEARLPTIVPSLFP